MQKTRGDSSRKVRIDIPTFEVFPASFTVIVGANGSGKSTFLDILGLILSPDAHDEAHFLLDMGTATPINLYHLKGREKTRIRRNYISYVLQTGGLLEFLTIRENIRFAARLRGKKMVDIDPVADQLGIADILDKRPGKVSGGQRQKAAIARALIQESPIILADEPSSALDTESARELMATFKELARAKKASLIMVTHDQDLAEQHADKIYRFRTEKTGNGVRSILHPDSSPSENNK